MEDTLKYKQKENDKASDIKKESYMNSSNEDLSDEKERR